MPERFSFGLTSGFPVDIEKEGPSASKITSVDFGQDFFPTKLL